MWSSSGSGGHLRLAAASDLVSSHSGLTTRTRRSADVSRLFAIRFFKLTWRPPESEICTTYSTYLPLALATLATNLMHTSIKVFFVNRLG
jgi:hypothetical protein